MLSWFEIENEGLVIARFDPVRIADKIKAEKLEIMYKNGIISKGTWLTEMGYIATAPQMNEYYVEPTKQATIWKI